MAYDSASSDVSVGFRDSAFVFLFIDFVEEVEVGCGRFRKAGRILRHAATNDTSFAGSL